MIKYLASHVTTYELCVEAIGRHKFYSWSGHNYLDTLEKLLAEWVEHVLGEIYWRAQGASTWLSITLVPWGERNPKEFVVKAVDMASRPNSIKLVSLIENSYLNHKSPLRK